MSVVIDPNIVLDDFGKSLPDTLMAKLQERKVATPMLFSVAAASTEAFSLHVPSYVAGLEVGQRLKAMRGNGVVKPIVYYSLNEQTFPEFPSYNKELYPYIFVVQSWIGRYTAVISQTKAYVAVGSSGSDVIYWENPSMRCNYSKGAWGAWSDNGSNVNIALKDEPYGWANYDIYKNGSLWLAASEPVLVE